MCRRGVGAPFSRGGVVGRRSGPVRALRSRGAFRTAVRPGRRGLRACPGGFHGGGVNGCGSAGRSGWAVGFRAGRGGGGAAGRLGPARGLLSGPAAGRRGTGRGARAVRAPCHAVPAGAGTPRYRERGPGRRRAPARPPVGPAGMPGGRPFAAGRRDGGTPGHRGGGRRRVRGGCAGRAVDGRARGFRRRERSGGRRIRCVPACKPLRARVLPSAVAPLRPGCARPAPARHCPPAPCPCRGPGGPAAARTGGRGRGVRGCGVFRRVGS